MESVVVVGVVPIDRTRRHEALLVRSRRIFQRLEYRLSYLRIVEVQLAILRDEAAAAIGDCEVVEDIVGIDAVRRHVQAKPVDVAHALRS